MSRNVKIVLVLAAVGVAYYVYTHRHTLLASPTARKMAASISANSVGLQAALRKVGGNNPRVHQDEVGV